jgi:UDP-N-acetylmuramate--alanine ligase
MSAIAELLMSLGYRVSGSDLKLSSITHRLASLGAVIFEGHRPEQLNDADVVVTSTAIAKDNPEVVEAGKRSIRTIARAEMLAELMRIKYAIAVSGAHGKTSTTSMVATILNEAGLDPTVVVGGVLKSLGTNARHGKGDYIVAEADESDGSFLKYSPAIAAVTNIDLEHLDFYNGIEEIKDNFVRFINSVPFYGLAVLCLDNEHIQQILPRITARYTTFGLNAQADLAAREICLKGRRGCFTVVHKKEVLGEITLNLAGKHNISNALAAIAVALELKVDFKVIKGALEKIEGVARRLEVKGEKKGITVVDDYGHHPTEVKTTLAAVREAWPGKRVVVVFQPHRYTRTRDLFNDFTRSFYQSDLLFVLPIYAASERPIEGIDSLKLCRGIEEHGHKNVLCVKDFETCISVLSSTLKPGDLVLTLGAGDVCNLGEQLLEILS